MTASDVLKLQLVGSFNLLRDRIATVSDREWTARGIPGANLLGFILWHAPRTIDWTIHCAIRGVPEVALRQEWTSLRASDYLYGAGITAEEADEVARSVSRDTILGYLEAVQDSAIGWLASQSDDELETVPELRAHQEVNPRYLSGPVWAEVSSLAGRPCWEILTRPSISHIRVHIGEIDTLIQALRAPDGPPRHSGAQAPTVSGRGPR